ncbi:MAG: ABC transporter ATP-binding protein [Candidatus Didemnitutus sp.]|nr:ABC transporter ATP-binding protein [Candidatus Didemnitutus sp.]
MDLRTLSTARAYLRDLDTVSAGRLRIAASVLLVSAALEAASLALLASLLHAGGVGSPGSAGPAAGLPRWMLWQLGLGSALALFLGARLALAALRRAQQAVQARLDADFSAALRARFHRAALDADWLFLTRQRTSDLTQAFLEELPRASHCTTHLVGLATTGVVTLVQLLTAFAIAPWFTLGVMAAAAAAALGLRSWQRRQHHLLGQQPAQRAGVAAAVTEHLAGLKIAKSYGRTDAHHGQFRELLGELSRLTVHAQDRAAHMRFWVEITSLATLGIFAAGALLWRPLGLGPLLLLGFIFSRLLAQASQLHSSWQQLAVNLPSYAATEAQRARYLAAAEPPDTAAHRLALTQELRFTRVSFRYAPDRPLALGEIDLVLPARRATALCGRSGAGKSTLADLALGLLQPDAGEVLVDGTSLTGAARHAWRRSIGYVPQETFLFHDTVRANLLWAKPDASPAELAAALHAAAAEEFVARLPHGLDTVIGDRGLRLSGGERQRLALARALLRRPSLLVLDEATSSLDPQNERLVQEALERLHGETTILLIAHRLSTVRAADRIVVLEAGRIAETGTWDELAAREHGAFRALLAADART